MIHSSLLRQIILEKVGERLNVRFPHSKMAKIWDFPKLGQRPPGGSRLDFFVWKLLKTVYCALLKSPDLILVDFGTFFFWPNIFCKATAWNREFWLKTLSGSSKDSELDLMLGEPQSCNFLHEYPKLMWKGSRHKESDLSYFKKIQKKIFLRFGAPKIVKFLDFFNQT